MACASCDGPVATVSSTWRNWSRTVSWHPAQVAAPASLSGVATAVREARRRGDGLRVIGSGHSFTPLVTTAGTTLTLDRLRGLVDADPAARRATLRAGTKLHDVGPLLDRHGIAMENLGDVDRQALAGALLTGTHGTGERFGILATQIAGMRLVTGRGEVLEIAEDDEDLLAAARVSLGLLGVVTDVTLRTVPRFRLRYVAERRRLDDVLDDLDDTVARHRHFEFFWLPHSEHVQAKAQDVTELPPTSAWRQHLNEVLRENVALLSVSEVARTFPGLAPVIGRLSGRLVGHVEGVDACHRVFANRRWFRFNEMEYNLPRAALPGVLAELRSLIERQRLRVHLPVEVRFASGDDIWLSPAFQRDSAYVAVHTYEDQPFRRYFLAAEEIFAAHGGRPHWAKVHSLSPEALRARYPRWEDFLRIRAELDPDGVFLNPYLRRLFGL
jgi:FAD-linked oxidoreductase